MNDEDLKKIGDVVDQKVNHALEPVKEKLDALWDQTVKLTENLTEVQETLDSHTSLLQHTSDNVKRINKRVTNVEDRLGIVSPPELSLVE